MIQTAPVWVQPKCVFPLPFVEAGAGSQWDFPQNLTLLSHSFSVASFLDNSLFVVVVVFPILLSTISTLGIISKLWVSELSSSQTIKSE